MENKKFIFSIWTIITLIFFIALAIYFNLPIFTAILISSLPGLVFIFVNKIKISKLLKEIYTSYKSVRNIFLLLGLIGIYIPLLGKSQGLHTLIYTFTPMLESFPLTFSAFLSSLILSMLLGTAVGTLSIISPLFLSTAVLSSISLPAVVGALVSGAYFGDRASYLSTSALLTTYVTDTNILKTVPRMLKDSILPFIISTALFYFITPIPTVDSSLLAKMKDVFNLNLWMLSPIVLLLLMIIFKTSVIKAIGSAVALALIISFFTEGTVSLSLLLHGYISPYEEYDFILNTNGFINMISVLLVILSSAFLNAVMKSSGLIKPLINPILRKSTNFKKTIVNTALTAAVLTIVTCNQTLTSIVTGDNFKNLYDEKNIDKTFLASTIGNAGIGIVGIIPWNVNGLLVTALTGVSTVSYFKWSFFPIILFIYSITIQPILYHKSNSKNK